MAHSVAKFVISCFGRIVFEGFFPVLFTDLLNLDILDLYKISTDVIVLEWWYYERFLRKKNLAKLITIHILKVLYNLKVKTMTHRILLVKHT